MVFLCSYWKTHLSPEDGWEYMMHEQQKLECTLTALCSTWLWVLTANPKASTCHCLTWKRSYKKWQRSLATLVHCAWLQLFKLNTKNLISWFRFVSLWCKLMPCSASSENEKECCVKLDFQLGNSCRDPHFWFCKDAGVWCNISGYDELMITIYFQANKMCQWVKDHNYMISQPV